MRGVCVPNLRRKWAGLGPSSSTGITMIMLFPAQRRLVLHAELGL